jgi:hypothetical protein
LLRNTTRDTESISVREPEVEPFAIEKRINCIGAGNTVIYEFDNGNGGHAYTCLILYVLAACLVVIPVNGVLSTLSNQVAHWVNSKITDASTAGQSEKRDNATITWGHIYDFSLNAGVNLGSPSDVAIDKSKLFKLGASNLAIHTLELHEDGFSTSATLPGSSIEKRSCLEQIHVHYWANAGH